MKYKIYVRADGHITCNPRCIYWNNGRRFGIEQIADIRPVASFKTGDCDLC